MEGIGGGSMSGSGGGSMEGGMGMGMGGGSDPFGGSSGSGGYVRRG